MMHEFLSKLATEYAYERAKNFSGSEFADFVRHDLAIEAKKQLTFLPYELKVKSSVGAGNWAAVPWLGFFDPLITETATQGFYVVYLVNPQTEEIFLSLNQGTTAAYTSFSQKVGKEHLKRTALDLAAKVPEFSKLFDSNPLDLGSSKALPQGYTAGHSFGRRYSAKDIDQDLFYSDFERMLAAYSALVDLGGTTPTDVMMSEAGSTDIEETRRYVLSRRIERVPNIRKKVLARRGSVCKGCGLNPQIHYSYRGPTKNTPLDVHHSKPISGLAEGESKRYRVPEDFLVLCPTCHRVIHKQLDTSDLETLKKSVNFQLK